MKEKEKERLKKIAKDLRVDVVDMVCEAGSGHPGGALSMTDIFSYLYFSGILNLDPKNPKKADRDRVVLSKGHACPILYSALAEKGYFDKSHLKTLRKFGSMLQGHPDMNKTPGVDISTGSLGQGLSCAVGMAIGAKLNNLESKIIAIVGDGESEEGQIWEAAMSAAHYRLDNLVAILDRNGLQIDGYTKDIMNSEPIIDKWKAFSWDVIEIDGHDFEQIEFSINKAFDTKGVPTVIIANTVKGKGISFMEGQCDWHGKAPSEEERDEAIELLCKLENE